MSDKYTRTDIRMKYEKRSDATERNRLNRERSKQRKEAGQFKYGWSRVGAPLTIKAWPVLAS